MRWNLLVGELDHLEAGVRFTISPRHALSLEYLYAYPTFDGDSIWNLFVRSRFDDLRLSYDVKLGPVRGYVRVFGRLFYDDGELTDRSCTVVPVPSYCSGVGNTYALSQAPVLDRLDAGGNIGARLDVARGYVRADAYLELGYGGRRTGFDLSTRLRIWRQILFLEGRATYAYFMDDAQPLDAGHSFGGQLGARVQLGRGIALHVIGEDNVNSFYQSQLRFYAVLDLAFLLGSNGFSQGIPRNGGPGMGGFGAPLAGGY
jgi:hypothetical protein